MPITHGRPRPADSERRLDPPSAKRVLVQTWPSIALTASLRAQRRYMSICQPARIRAGTAFHSIGRLRGELVFRNQWWARPLRNSNHSVCSRASSGLVVVGEVRTFITLGESRKSFRPGLSKTARVPMISKPDLPGGSFPALQNAFAPMEDVLGDGCYHLRGRMLI